MMLLPVWDSGQIALKEMWVFSLGDASPSCLPSQTVRTTKVAAAAQGLATYRFQLRSGRRLRTTLDCSCKVGTAA